MSTFADLASLNDLDSIANNHSSFLSYRPWTGNHSPDLEPACLDKDKFDIDSDIDIDIPGHQHPAGGTLQPDVAVTNLKQDSQSVSILELTCPAEHRISAANTLKMDKYSHFETDQNGKNVTVKAFE